MSIYDNLKKNTITKNSEENLILFHFVDGAFVEIKGPIKASYVVRFIDQDKREIVYETTLSNNTWARPNIEYFVNWQIEVVKNGKVILDHKYNATDKNVFIAFESESLGDTIAYMPYVFEFKKKHQCNVILSTHYNHLFESVYPELKFVSPGETVHGLYALYRIVYSHNSNKEPVLPNTIPLQKVACNILGLQYKEIKPRIYNQSKYAHFSPLVTIATNSTAGCKFWTREGWQEVINFLVSKGYTVLNVSKERNEFDNCQYLDYDETFQSTIDAIKSSEFFIGLSSGLSWLAWALDVPVVMIANFTEKWNEFDCIRVVNENVCHGCWNSHLYKFDRGDWNWCPKHQGTDRQFECMTSISAEMVISKLPLP